MTKFAHLTILAALTTSVFTMPAAAKFPDAAVLSTVPAESCLNLDEAMKLSATRDPNVLITKAQETAADADVKEAKSLFRPRVSAFGRSGLGDTGIVDSGVSNQVGIRASQRIFDFGDSKYARRAADYGYKASLEDTRQARLRAAQQTGFAYLELIEAEEQLALTNRRRDYFSRQLTAVDNLLNVGAATRTERAAVASQLADAEAFVLELEFRQEQALTQVQIDTGTSADLCKTGSVETTLKTRVAALSNPETAAQIALEKNPEIKALDSRLESLEATRKRERVSRLPVIDIVATGAYSSFGGFDNFEYRDRVGLDVSVPLYAGNAIVANNQRASASTSIARGQLLDRKRQLRKDVNIGYRRALSLKEQLVSRIDVEEQTKLQFEAAEIEQKSGTKTLRDLVETRLEYEQAGFQRIRMKYDLMRQQLELLSLTANVFEG